MTNAPKEARRSSDPVNTGRRRRLQAAAGTPAARLLLYRVWTLVGACILGIFILNVMGVLAPVIEFLAVGALIAFIESPIVNFLERHRVPRGAAAFVGLFVVVAAIALLFMTVVPIITEQVMEILQRLPSQLRGLGDWISELADGFSSLATTDLADGANEALRSLAASLAGYVTELAGEMGKGVVNPIRLLGNLLIQSDAQLIHFSGGGALNTIPTTASAIMTIKDPNLFVHWRALAQSLGGQMDFAPSDVPAYIWSPIDYQAAMDFLLSLPNGITAHMPHYPMIPACSGNMGRVDCTDNQLTYHLLLRGTPEQALERAARGCALLADRCGFDPAGEASYPTWEEDPDNPLAQRMSQLWQARNGAPMEIDPTHAGSELSVLTQLRPELTAVETGVTIQYPYSTQERIDLASLPSYVQLLQDALEDIAQKG